MSKERLKKEIEERLGSTDPVKWVKECMHPLEKEIKEFWSKLTDFNIRHMKMTDVDTFKKSLDDYAREYPDVDIQVSGFIFSAKKRD